MLRAIIIAGLLFSSAVFAAGIPGGGKARLKTVLACETSMLSKLSPELQEQLGRLKILFEKYDIMMITAPDIVRANLGMSEAGLFAEMNSAANRILDQRSPADPGRVAVYIDAIEKQIARAFDAQKPNRDRSQIPGKRAMESRMFDEDWSDLAPQQEQRQSRPLNPYPLEPQHYTDDFGGLPPQFRRAWPPREKP